MMVVVNQSFIYINNFLALFFAGYAYSLATIFAVFAGITSYLFLLLLLREVMYQDLVLIPRIGKKLADFLYKIGLVGDRK